MNHYSDIREALTPQRVSRKVALALSGTVLGIDPGPSASAYALIRPDYSIIRALKLPNDQMHHHLSAALDGDGVRHVAIEGLACYGRPVGRETFETAYEVGDCRAECRRHGVPWTIYARPEYANAIAGCGKVTDAVLYQALRLRFGGTRRGEPLFALKGESDLRSAYGLVVYWLDCQRRGGK